MKLNYSFLRRVYYHRIMPLWSPEMRETEEWKDKIMIYANNYCNLSCYSCSTQCDRPEGSTPFREKNYITPLDNIKKFIKLLDGYRPESWIRICGGEPSLCGPDYIKQICDMAHSYNRKVSIITNGARIEECDPNWFDFITLDDHDINEKKINEVKSLFHHHRYHKYHIYKVRTHIDLQTQRSGYTSAGLRCRAWMKPIGLYRDVVYPCCVLPFLDGWNMNNKVEEACRYSGWAIDNPNLVEHLENWHSYIHPDIIYACSLQCWRDGPNVVYHPVTEKKT